MLEALAAQLVSASVGVLASNLFIGHMPEDPDNCIALFEYSGNEPRETMNASTSTIEAPSVQVMGRATTYPVGRSLMVSARNSLTSITNQTISGVRFLRVNQLSAINSMGRDATERSVFTLSLQVMVER